MVEIIGCHKKGLQFNFRNRLQGSMYLETIASEICKLFGDNLNQNSPTLENLVSIE